MTWPGTQVGGADGGPAHPWGTSVRVFVQAGLAAGRNWHMGPHPQDALDAGNVMGHVTEGTGSGGLWVDLACDCISVEVDDGATSSAGIFARDEAATLDVLVYDPQRLYDPLNSASPYWYKGKSRLTAGTPLRVFVEVLNAAGTGVVSYTLFNGTADRWMAQIEPVSQERRTRITATGAIKAMVAQDYAELASPVGDGDTTAQRLARLVSYFNYTQGPLVQGDSGVSGVTLQGSTLAQSMWEMLNRCIDDELGYLHVLPNGTIRWWSRNTWFSLPPTALTVGCKPGVSAFDIVTDTTMGAADEQLRNAVYAARAGGTQQVAKSQPSIAAHGGIESTLNRTDLGLRDDAQVATWAGQIVMLYAYPQPAPVSLSLLPAVHGETDGHIWRAVLGTRFIDDGVRLVWTPTDSAALDQVLRVYGAKHTIDANGWRIDWSLIPAQLTPGNVWHMGPHPFDRLDSGNVMGFVKTGALAQEVAA